MSWVKSATDFVTGGKGAIGELNRQRMLWGGRAAAKRNEARIDALEANQRMLSSEVYAGDGQQQAKLQLSTAEKSKLINPLNVKNITLMQVHAGNTKKDILFAQKISEKNTRLLEQFAKSAKEIEKNTKVIKDQDTSIKKRDSDIGKAMSGAIKQGSEFALKKAAETKGWLSNMLSESWKAFLASGLMGGGIGLVKNLFKGVGLLKFLKYLKPSSALNGLETIAETFGKFSPSNLKFVSWYWKELIKAGFQNKLKWLIGLPKASWTGLKNVAKHAAAFGKAEWTALKKIVKGPLGKLGKVGLAGYIASEATAGVVKLMGIPETEVDNAEKRFWGWIRDAVFSPKESGKQFLKFWSDPLIYNAIWKQLKASGNKILESLGVVDTQEEKRKKKQKKENTKQTLGIKIAEIIFKISKLNKSDKKYARYHERLGKLLYRFKNETGVNYSDTIQLTGYQLNIVNNALNTYSMGVDKFFYGSPKVKKTGAKNKPRESTFSGTGSISKRFDGNLSSSNSALGIDENGVPLGQPVNGLIPAIWAQLDVDPAFRKIIDHIENRGTGSYTLTSSRSSAYGRYQFMPETAKGVAKKLGIPQDSWKDPINQDKLFQQFTSDNKKAIKGRGIDVNVWTMWIAHNLGTGALNFMTGKTDKPYEGALKAIKNQMPGNPNYKDALEARAEYVSYYKDKIAKIIGGKSNAPTPTQKYKPFKSNITLPKPKSKQKRNAPMSSSDISTIRQYTPDFGAPIDYSGKRVEVGTEWMTAQNVSDVIQLYGSAANGGFSKLDKTFATRIVGMAAEYKKLTGKKLIITSAYRDINKQDELYRKALIKYKGNEKLARKWVAPPGNSMHNWGFAVDIDYSNNGGQVDICNMYGLLEKYKLYRPMRNERWHVEPIESIGHRGQKGKFLSLADAGETSTVIMGGDIGGISMPSNLGGSINLPTANTTTNKNTTSPLKSYKSPVYMDRASTESLISQQFNSTYGSNFINNSQNQKTIDGIPVALPSELIE